MKEIQHFLKKIAYVSFTFQLKRLCLTNKCSVLSPGCAGLLVCITRGHRSAGRSAGAPRGTAAAAAQCKLPTTVLTRDVQAPKARGTAVNAGYRPPLLAVTHKSYDDYVSSILFAHKEVW